MALPRDDAGDGGDDQPDEEETDLERRHLWKGSFLMKPRWLISRSTQNSIGPGTMTFGKIAAAAVRTQSSSSHLKHILNMLKTFFLTFGVTSVAGANKVGDY